MKKHIEVETVSPNLTIRRCLGCGDAGGSTPNATEVDRKIFADWFEFKHKDCAKRKRDREAAPEGANR